MHYIDLGIILFFLGGISAYGIYNSRKNKSAEDYFLAGRNTPWWVAMFSIVATETSVLTFVSVPGLAYRGDWFFLQLAMGYILGRVLVSIFLLPQYFKGNITSIYEILGSRFGKPVQKTASGIFLITRLFADGVRFLATAVVVQVVTGWPIWMAVLIIGAVTMVYTLSGGIRTVLWVDSFQFVLYLTGGAIVIFFILNSSEFSGWEPLLEAGKTRIFRFTTDNMFKDAWFFGSAFLGGILLSFASHGADYMMVQRVLACSNLSSARKAMIGSGFFVFLQFLIFLLAGSLIWLFTGGVEMTKDRELSTFIVDHLPIGIRGILLAGVLSAAMSTLSSSINSLASSTIHDWMQKNISLKRSLIVSGVWAILLISLALLFDEGNTAVVVLGLKIASFTYGGLLGLFILSCSNKKFTTPVLIFGLLSSLGTVFFLQWLGVAWTWYIGAAVVLNLAVVHGLHYLGWKRGFGFAVILFITGYFSAVGGQYQNGLEVLSEDGFSVLKGKNVAVVVNHTSVDYHDDHLIKLAHDEGVRIKAVFSPEHGFKGVVGAGEKVDNGFENLTGAPIYSLYGKTKKPTSEMLKGIDILIFDMQDIGVRYYTYVSTLTLAMESAAENGIPFIVLDRVNPLGHEVEGVILEMEFASFVGMHPIPVRHGMSVGELAQMINGESWLENGMKADLNVIAYKGKIDEKVKAHAFNVPPSPNMPNVETAWLYQGLCLLEGTNLSEGRGTDLPFKLFGAPWLDNKVLADKLQKFSSKSDKYELISFTPQSIPAAKYPKYEGEECKGIRIITLEHPLIWTIHLLQILQDQHPEKFKFLDTNFIDKLYGSDRLRLANEKDITAKKLLASDTTYTQFIELRKKYLIY
jgi:SSS family transporter